MSYKLYLHETVMKETVKGILLWDSNDGMGWNSTYSVNRVAEWKPLSPFSSFSLDKLVIVGDAEELIIQHIQVDIDVIYIEKTKKARLFSHFLYLFKE